MEPPPTGTLWLLTFGATGVVGVDVAGGVAAGGGARSRVSREQVMKDCRRRFGEAAWRTCLGEP